MNQKNNGAWWFVFIVLLAACLIVGAVKHHKDVASGIDQGGSTMVGDQTATDTAADSTEDTSAGSVTAASGTGAASISYQNALVKYASSRLQFDNSCQMTPNNTTYKVGTIIMLDNRSASTRTFHLGTMGNVTVKGYGFKLVQLTSSILPNSFAVDCDAHQNVGLIKIQA